MFSRLQLTDEEECGNPPSGAVWQSRHADAGLLKDAESGQAIGQPPEV
jgi:hypothetical protein